jgi:hypothetical protein
MYLLHNLIYFFIFTKNLELPQIFQEVAHPEVGKYFHEFAGNRYIPNNATAIYNYHLITTAPIFHCRSSGFIRGGLLCLRSALLVLWYCVATVVYHVFPLLFVNRGSRDQMVVVYGSRRCMSQRHVMALE